jgi:hypothetical protein
VELTFVVVVFLAVAAALLLKRRPPKQQPPSPVFKCARCGASTQHNKRSIEAWRNGKTKFFCQACHAKLLQSHPPDRYATQHPGPSGNSGCLGVVVLLLFGALFIWAYA